MSAAAEAVDARLRAGVGILKPPAAGQSEFRGATLHKLNQALRVAGDVNAHPEFRAAMLGLDRQEETVGRRLFRSAFFGKLIVEIEGASGVVGRPDVEQAGKMGEVVGHVGLLKRQSLARGRAD